MDQLLLAHAVARIFKHWLYLFSRNFQFVSQIQARSWIFKGRSYLALYFNFFYTATYILLLFSSICLALTSQLKHVRGSIIHLSCTYKQSSQQCKQNFSCWPVILIQGNQQILQEILKQRTVVFFIFSNCIASNDIYVNILHF